MSATAHAMPRRTTCRQWTERGLAHYLGAVCAEGLAVALLGLGSWPLASLAALVHLIAARLAVEVAGRRADLSRAERDLVWLLALGVPVLGVLLGWLVPRPRGVAAEADAHEAFEAARARRSGGETDAMGLGDGDPASRSLALSGTFDRDVRARLDVESHLDVLRFGDRTLRSNLVLKLAERGGPRDLALLRRVLEDPEEELRIQAFLQLREARNRHLASLAARIGAAAEAEASAPLTSSGATPSDGLHAASAAWLEVARGHLELAESGALDPALVGFELQRALDAARRACPNHAARALELRVLARLGSQAEAQRALADLGDELDAAPELLAASAEVAFRAGHLGAVRAAAARLTSTGSVVPEWMATITAAHGAASIAALERVCTLDSEDAGDGAREVCHAG